MAAFALAAGVNQLLRLLDRLREKPTPIETYETKTSALIERQHVERRIQKVEADIVRLSGDIHTLGVTLAETGESRARRLHERIDTVRAELATQISNMPSQMVALLKNTGAIE
jgi:hypothetical protein